MSINANEKIIDHMRNKWTQRKEEEPTLKRLNELSDGVDSSNHYKLFFDHPISHSQLE